MANATAIHGTIIDHGKAPYKNNPENNLSYYVKLNQNGSDKTFWGNGIEDAIKEAELKNGDVATFVDKGTQAVNVPDKNNVGQFIQAKKRFWEAEKYEPSVELNNSIEVDNAPDIDVDAGQSSSTPQASDIDLSKGEAVKVDASKKRSLPQSIENNYIAIAKNRWLKDAKVNFYDKADPKSVAFEDRTTALATSKSDVKTVRSMLDLAQDKGWSSIKIKGDAEFKRQMWLEAQMRGIETKGYKPTEQDVAELQAIQEGQTKNEVTNDYQRSKEINAQKAQDQESAVSAPEATNDSKSDITATAAADAVIDDVDGKEEINEGMSQEQRQAILIKLNENQDVQELRESVDLATKNIPNQSWLNDAANNKFENTLIEMNEHSENTGKQFSKDELIELAKNDINEVGKALPQADLQAVNERLDTEIDAERFVGYEYKEQIAGRISNERLAEISEQAVINNPEASNQDLHTEIVAEINKDLDVLADDPNWGESNIVLQKGSIAEVYSNSENKPVELTNLALSEIEKEAYSKALDEDWEAVIGGDNTEVQANFDQKIADIEREQNFEKEYASREVEDTVYDKSFDSPILEAKAEAELEAQNFNVDLARKEDIPYDRLGDLGRQYRDNPNNDQSVTNRMLDVAEERAYDDLENEVYQGNTTFNDSEAKQRPFFIQRLDELKAGREQQTPNAEADQSAEANKKSVSEQAKDASKAVAIDGSVEVATGGNYTAMAAVGSIAQDKAETKVLEAVKETDVFKNVVDKSVAQHFDKQFEKYEALHQDLEDHRSAETKVNNHKYHNDPEPSNEVYAKSTPEVKEAVINNLAENMTNDTKQVLTENNINQEQIERIAEFVNTDVRDRAAIDADSAKVASPMSDYVQATNAHIIRSLGTEKGVEIANQNSEKMLGDKINVEPLSAEKNGRYAEIVSDKLNEHNIDKLTIAKAQAIIHDPNSKDIQPQQTVDKYQQRIGEELYKSGYGKDSIKIMDEITDKHYGIERGTPEFIEPAQRLGDVTADKAQAEDKQQDNSLSTDDKGFKEVKVVEDTKIGDATRGAKIDTDKNSTKAVGIAAMRSMIEELYKNDAQKRESALKSIDEATPEILAGNRPDPQVDIKQQPAQVQIQTTKQPDMDRGR